MASPESQWEGIKDFLGCCNLNCSCTCKSSCCTLHKNCPCIELVYFMASKVNTEKWLTDVLSLKMVSYILLSVKQVLLFSVSPV